MNKIQSIEIKKIKGIEERQFSLDLIPNKPSILIAPNGYGKSSFAIAFDSLKQNKLNVDKKYWYKSNENNDSKIVLNIKYNGEVKELEANKDKNDIAKEFDVFVINSQLTSTAKRINNAMTSNLSINKIQIRDKIPTKEVLNYSIINLKGRLKSNGKLIYNIKDIIKNDYNVKQIYENRHILEKLTKVRASKELYEIIDKIGNSKIKGNKNKIISEIELNLSNDIKDLSYFDDIKSFLKVLKGINVDQILYTEIMLIFAEILEIYTLNKSKLNNIYKYSCYMMEKVELKELYSTFNNTWKDIRPVESKKDGLYIEFPNANLISNGQRDILSFIGLLFKSKSKLNKDKNILIIDEVFDYLDDSNLIAAQYYLSEYIEIFKKSGKDLYPIILTHLDPKYFKNFCFKKQREYYLKESRNFKNDGLKTLLLKRNDPKIKEPVSKYFLHYHPEDCVLQKEFEELKIQKDIDTSNKLKEKSYLEMEKYINCKSYNPLYTFLAVRLKIEERVYCLLQSEEHKIEFLRLHGTTNKLEFADNLGIKIPEMYYLLGIIYNDSMHIDSEGKNINRLCYKLDNEVIRSIISKV